MINTVLASTKSARHGRPFAEDESSGVTARPGRLTGAITVFALLVQQGAFISIPAIVNGAKEPSIVDPYNTLAVAISLATIGLAMTNSAKRALVLARQNAPSVLFASIVMLSSIWSIHPDISLRRGIGYVLTLMVAAHLVIRYKHEDLIRILSTSFLISAAASIIYVVIAPQYGIMVGGELTGAWRGVFQHKNVMGPIMAVAVFCELYLMSLDGRKHLYRHGVSLLMFLTLVFFSHSATGWVITALFCGGAFAYFLWRWQPLVMAAMLVSGSLATLFIALVAWSEPLILLDVLGKDATFTGRTSVWEVALVFIRERPLLGWGYRAMWVPNDPTTIFANRVTGNWSAPSAHNAFLEIALELGILGLTAISLVLLNSLYRSVRCWMQSTGPLGYFSTIYIIGTLLAAMTEVTIGQNQVVSWLVFCVLAFSCGIQLLNSSPKLNTSRNSFDIPRRTVA